MRQTVTVMTKRIPQSFRSVPNIGFPRNISECKSIYCSEQGKSFWKLTMNTNEGLNVDLRLAVRGLQVDKSIYQQVLGAI